MALNNKVTESGTANTIVETNNFREVLKHFDHHGELKDKGTRLKIECQICLSKDLAIVNAGQGQPSPDTHEKYAVLPRCGHAFGHQCLNSWFEGEDNRPSCPMCRELAYCENHKEAFDAFGDLQKAATRQANEIKKIRNLIEIPLCRGCGDRERDIGKRNDLPEYREQRMSSIFWMAMAGL